MPGTGMYKKSLFYRTKNLWNSLPVEWDMKKLGYSKFKEQLKDIILKRSGASVINY